MAGLIEQPRHYTRAEAQQQVRDRASSLILRPAALRQMAHLRAALFEDDDRTVDHADLQACLSGGVVIEDVGYSRGGAQVTVAGADREGRRLTVYVQLADDEDLPLFIETFVLKP
ncbi:MAG TPA: hypothetical protein VEK79_21815 [Thermoanaerobaculia bacterium]|nr:hypothetical protein [Thermoanaerobaculia bacterium]